MVIARASSSPEHGTPALAAEGRGYYGISEAAALLGVSRVTIWRRIRDGQLPALRLGHRTARIKRADLERLLVQIRSGEPRAWLAKGRGDAAAAQGEHGYDRAPRADLTQLGPSDHVAQLYEADAFLAGAVADFLAAGLRAGDAAIVIATPTHREQIDERLRACGAEVDAARDSGRYVVLDAAETLASLLVDGEPYAERFAEVVGGFVARAAADARSIRAFGEMVGLLAAAGNGAAAIRLEGFWNELGRTHVFALVCGYPLAEISAAAPAQLIDEVAASHTRIVPAESYSALADPHDRLRAIAVLQQKASSLNAEIAARARAEEQLWSALAAERSAREQAEGALRTRDEFLSVASHELRTPLTSLSGYAQVAVRRLERDGQLEPQRAAQAMRAITGQVDKLSRLIDQLLDVSRLEAGKLTLIRTQTDLVALVEHIVLGARARGERHAISVEAPPDLTACVDALRLEQVLTNLLDNATRYSPAGGTIEVVLSWVGDLAVDLSVRDHGLGIAPEQRGQLFERFHQAHGTSHRSGLGLGLSMSRQIVELHGGQIWAEFPEDGGTRIVVRLPIE